MKYNTGNIYNFDDFNNYNDMDKIERSFKNNHVDTQNLPKNSKLVYNPITKKMEDMTKKQFDDLKRKLNESLKFTENTFDLILKSKGIDEIKNILKDFSLTEPSEIDNMSEDELRKEWKIITEDENEN